MEGSADVRRLREGDEAGVLAVAADTAFFGEPVEAFLDDRRLFLDVLYRDYVREEADLVWVAAASCSPEQVVGFCLGSADTRAQAGRARRAVLRAWLGLLAGRYRLGRRTWSFAWQRLKGLVARPGLPIDLAAYPAHLHLNVRAGFRGQGLGGRLLSAFLSQLEDRGVAGVHLSTTDANRAACALYEKAGFRRLGAVPSDAWASTMGRVEVRAYGLALPRESSR